VAALPRTVTVVSDDSAWAEEVRAAFHSVGIDPLALSELRLDNDRPFALLLDASLAPHDGTELGSELRMLLREICPPLLLATREARPLTAEERDAFVGAVWRSAEPSALAAEAVRMLARLPATASGVVLRRRVLPDRGRKRSGD
jgi:hypothetical protein